MAKTQEQLLEEELSSLTPEELQQYEAELQSQSLPQRQKGQTHYVDPQSGRTVKYPENMQPSQEELVQSDIEMAKAAGYGAVEGIPFAKDAAAAIEAVYQTGTENFGEEYTANRKEWDEAINKAEQDYPAAFMVGDISSGMVMPGVGGVKGAMLFGALSGASRQEDRNPFNMLASAATGAAITGTTAGVITGAVKATSFVGQKLGLLASNASKEAIGAYSGKHLRDLNRHIDKTGTQGATAAQKTQEFSDRLLKTQVDGEPLLAGFQSFARTAEKAGKARQMHGSTLGKIVDELDTIVPDKVNAKSLYQSMKARLGIEDMKLSKDPNTVEIAKAYEARLKEQFMDTIEEVVPQVVKRPMMGSNGMPITDASGNPILVDEVVDTVKKSFKFKEFSPKELHRTKLDFSQSSRKVSTAFEKAGQVDKQRMLSADETFSKEVINVFNEAMDEVSSKAGATNPDLLNAYRTANRDYSDMLMVEKIAQHNADSMSSGPMAMLKQAFGVRGLLVAQIQNSTGAKKALAISVDLYFITCSN